jgi:hypothetical protein
VRRLIDSIQVLLVADPEKVDLIEQWATYYRQHGVPAATPSAKDTRDRVQCLRDLLDEVTADRPEAMRALEAFIRTLSLEARCRLLLPRLQRLPADDVLAVEALIAEKEQHRPAI